MIAFLITEIDDPDEGLNDVDIRALYEHAMDCFTLILQTEIDKNLETFNEAN